MRGAELVDLYYSRESFQDHPVDLRGADILGASLEDDAYLFRVDKTTKREDWRDFRSG